MSIDGWQYIGALFYCSDMNIQTMSDILKMLMTFSGRALFMV